ncbi:MAG TPA: nodulation protein NfeD [Anaerolineaceae bacterium]
MLKRAGRMIIWWACVILLIVPAVSAAAQSSARSAMLLTANGELTPAMVQYLNRGLSEAQQQNAEVVILELNTPGGQIDLMTQMVTAIRASQVPVVVYVGPRGGMAASAGTVISLAGHLTAMAPETMIGAASPVGAQGEDLGQTEAVKVKESLKATVRSLSTRRSPAAIQLAENMIDKAQAVSADEAFKAGLVDYIAVDPQDLLNQINGARVVTVSGERTLNTTGIPIQPVPISLIEQLLLTLINPNVVFLLLTLGIQALLIEFSHPGGWVAGFVGVVALALAIYGLGVLPVNWFGIVFLATSFVLFFLDVKAPTHGALTAVGLGSFIVGALVLFNSPNVPSFERVSVPLVVGTGIFIAAIFFTIVSFGLRARHAPLRMGRSQIIGRIGVARTALDPLGTVQVGGELWTARLAEGEAPIQKGTPVEVQNLEGVRLRVRRIQPSDALSDQPV